MTAFNIFLKADHTFFVDLQFVFETRVFSEDDKSSDKRIKDLSTKYEDKNDRLLKRDMKAVDDLCLRLRLVT